MKNRFISLIKESAGVVYSGDVVVKEEIDISDEEIERIVDKLLNNGATIPVRCKHCLHSDLIYPQKEMGKEAKEVRYCKFRKCTVSPDGFCDSGAPSKEEHKTKEQ